MRPKAYEIGCRLALMNILHQRDTELIASARPDPEAL